MRPQERVSSPLIDSGGHSAAVVVPRVGIVPDERPF
jgi:hypothetical protein